MSWMTSEQTEQSQTIAATHVLSDGRDLSAAARNFMVFKRPKLFEVPKDVLDDPRTKLGFNAGGQGGKMSAVRPYVGTPNQVWPGISSVNPDFDEFKYTYAVEASAAFKPNIDKNGFADESAVVRDFSALLSASGVKMARANAPYVDQTEVRAERGFATDFVSPRHKAIARCIHRAMFGKRVAESDFSFSVISNTRMPSHVGGHGSQAWKQGMIRSQLLDAENILNKFAKRDFHGLYRDHQILMAAMLGERGQPEGVKDILKGDLTPKAREVNDAPFALSGGRNGQRSVASKTEITRDIFGLKYGVGMRVRTVYALCGQLSAFITPWLVGCRQHYFHEFGYTWHHSTPENIYEGIKDFVELIGLDVTTMDQFFPQFFLRYHAEWMKDYMDPRFAEILGMVNGVPYYAPQLAPGDKPFWAGDPRDPSTFNIDVGLSSGRPDNPDLGKWYMTTVYFCLMDDYLGDLLNIGFNEQDSIEKCLRGEHPAFGLKDMGDDAVIGLRGGFGHLATAMNSDLDEAGQTKKASLSPYAILDKENGIAFLGNVIYKDPLGVIGRPKPNPVTFVVNRHCPERGINTPNKMYWAHGYLAALEHYSRAGSIIGDLDRMEQDIWRIKMPGYPTPRQMAEKARRERPLPITSSLSIKDIEVLLDHQKMQWKFLPSEISKDVRDLFTATVEGQFIDKCIGRYMH